MPVPRPIAPPLKDAPGVVTTLNAVRLRQGFLLRGTRPARVAAQVKEALMRFSSTDSYVAPPDLAVAVNAAVVLERPLLVKGEPGTGKT